MNPRSIVLLAFLALLAACPAAARGRDRLGGAGRRRAVRVRAHGRRAGLEAAVFRRGHEAAALDARQLVTWGAFVEPAREVQIVLAGGGLIVAAEARIDKEQLRGESASLGKFGLPLELVSGIIFRPPADRAVLDRLIERFGEGAQTDRLLLDNGDELTGTLIGGGEANAAAKSLVLETPAGKVDVALDKLVAVVFNPSLLERPKNARLRAWVGLSDGSRFVALDFTAAGDKATLKLPGGVELNAKLSAIVALQVLGGRAVYLSDLKPAGYRYIPLLELSWPLAVDRSVLGSQLRAGRHVYLKGLGMHSPSRATYELDGQYRRFEAELAIDDESGSHGSVVFRVFTDDGSGKLQERSASEVVRGGQPSVPLSVDVTGAKKISLLVDYADRGDELDHADWLNARLIR